MKIISSSSMLLLTIILMDILGGAEVDLFIPSFPELATQFGLTPFWLETLLSINFLGFCLSLFFVGSFSDRYGRKPIILIGLIIFIIGTLFCLRAELYNFLIVGRFFQGIGAAAPSILCYLVIADLYSLKKQQYLMAVLNGMVNATIGIAPIIGCYITMHFHWQGNFSALLIMALIVLTMTIFFVPVNKKNNKDVSIQIDSKIIFKSKSFIILILSIISMFVPYWIFVGISPILYMQDLGVSITHFGYYQGVLAFVFAIGSVISGLLIDKYDHLKMLYLSTFIYALGLISIILVALLGSINPLVITLAFLISIIGTIIPSTILYPICINLIPQAKGKVSAIMHGSRLLITAVLLEIAGYYYDSSFKNIGIIISCVIIISLITLILVIRNRELMKSLYEMSDDQGH